MLVIAQPFSPVIASPLFIVIASEAWQSLDQILNPKSEILNNIKFFHPHLNPLPSRERIIVLPP
jgi:hypothetical protein